MPESSSSRSEAWQRPIDPSTVPGAVRQVVTKGVTGSTSLHLTRRQIALLIYYPIVLATAELLLVFANLSQDGILALVGLLLDVLLVLSLPVQASFFAAKDRAFASFMGSLMLPPLIRVVTLATPLDLFTQTEWLIVVSVPLLLACAALMRALGLRPRDVFLGIGERRYLTVNVTLVASGFAFGFLEFRILRPQPWIDTPGLSQLLFGTVAIFLATGLTEELIYRGILLRTGSQFLGARGGLLYVTLVFAILHAGFGSVPDFILVFILGMAFGAVVLLTRGLWGAMAAHTVANVVLYLILPFGF